jgi:hypothetical protein
VEETDDNGKLTEPMLLECFRIIYGIYKMGFEAGRKEALERNHNRLWSGRVSGKKTSATEQGEAQEAERPEKK